MIKVDSFSFGSIVLDSKKYARDVLLLPNGFVKKRRGGFWKFGSHTIKKLEIEELAGASPDVVIVGIGTDAKAKLEADVESFAKESKPELVVLPSSEAIEELNKPLDRGKRVAALIHITC